MGDEGEEDEEEEKGPSLLKQILTFLLFTFLFVPGAWWFRPENHSAASVMYKPKTRSALHCYDYRPTVSDELRAFYTVRENPCVKTIGWGKASAGHCG